MGCASLNPSRFLSRCRECLAALIWCLASGALLASCHVAAGQASTPIPVIANAIGGATILPGDSYDPNGLLLQPRWASPRPDINRLCGFHVTESGLSVRVLALGDSSCTTQSAFLTLNEPFLFTAAVACNLQDQSGRVRGHVNWFPVTVSGKLLRFTFNPVDHDYSLFVSSEGAGAELTSGNSARDSLELEFDSREVVEPMALSSPEGELRWWNGLNDLARFKRGKGVSELLQGHLLVATGLLSLDGIHNFQTELHPVWGLAINVQRERDHDVWLIFARNMGNQGECSQGQLPFDLRPDSSTSGSFEYALNVPWFDDADSATVLWGSGHSFFASTNSAIDGPRLRQNPHTRQLTVAFRLPRARKANREALVYGELHVQWHVGASDSMVMPPPDRDERRAYDADSVQAIKSLERRLGIRNFQTLGTLVDQLPPGQRGAVIDSVESNLQASGLELQDLLSAGLSDGQSLMRSYSPPHDSTIVTSETVRAISPWEPQPERVLFAPSEVPDGVALITRRTLCRLPQFMDQARVCRAAALSGMWSFAATASWRSTFAVHIGPQLDADFTLRRTYWGLFRLGLHTQWHSVLGDSLILPTDVGVLSPRISASVIAPLTARYWRLILSARADLPAFVVTGKPPNPRPQYHVHYGAILGLDLGVRVFQRIDCIARVSEFVVHRTTGAWANNFGLRLWY